MDLGLAGLNGTSHAVPGQLHDHQQGRRARDGHHAGQSKGLFSKAVQLQVDDTASLWNKPSLPKWDDEGDDRGEKQRRAELNEEITDMDRKFGDPLDHGEEVSRMKGKNQRKRRKIHLVVLTHGLHSNLGSDMLYLKESIDATAKQACIDARKRKARHDSQAPTVPVPSINPVIPQNNESATSTKAQQDNETSTAPLVGSQNDNKSTDEVYDSDEEEEVIVRGFSGNAVRTERGIQYLGKRLAKYVLSMTYPDQPYLPVKKSVSKSLSRVLTGQDPADFHAGFPSHQHSSICKEARSTSSPAYQITSISFVAHSLGGLTQTYAIAYIHKHSPEFFKKIKPINFVTLASPFLGLSNENPIYVKFALNFGLVGRTGQDLGLTWRAPTMVRSGWGAMIGGIGTDGHRAQRQLDPGSKPLLRILPSGPAHQVLKMFRNRTVYSNVVNDGIVPLRTSCLLFLDWKGLGRVEKARRENGLVGTMAGWGWAELTGANSTAKKVSRGWFDGETVSNDENSAEEGANTPTRQGDGDTVPQPTDDAAKDESTEGSQNVSTSIQRVKGRNRDPESEEPSLDKVQHQSSQQTTSSFSGFLSLLRPSNARQNSHPSPKQIRVFSRSQTLIPGQDNGDSADPESSGSHNSSMRPRATSASSINKDQEDVYTPPKTTVFEAAGDILNPPLPTEEYLTDPTSRPRTIFHDRVYHPDDIPPPPVKRRPSILRSLSAEARDGHRSSVSDNTVPALGSQNTNTGGMKVEEKIARAYHRDLSWRKVLVRLEPDAHNNIVVRRMFANAYGWPVIKHLVDTHFADTLAATTADDLESNDERANPMEEAVGEHGNEVRGQSQKLSDVTETERRETDDEVSELKSPLETDMNSSTKRPQMIRDDSVLWDDRFFEPTDDEDDDFEYDNHTMTRGPLSNYDTGHARGSSRTPRKTSNQGSAHHLGLPKSIALDDSAQKRPVSPTSPKGETRSIMIPASSSIMTSMNTNRIGLGKSMVDHVGLAVLPKIDTQNSPK